MKPVVEYRPSFMRGLEIDAFFRHHRTALEVQGARHRLHNIVDCDRKKRTLCQLNVNFLKFFFFLFN